MKARFLKVSVVKKGTIAVDITVSSLGYDSSDPVGIQILAKGGPVGLLDAVDGPEDLRVALQKDARQPDML